jgi:hypothetical protein
VLVVAADGSGDDPDNTHLMRFARRAERLRERERRPGDPLQAGERKHLIAEEYLAAHPPDRRGVFVVPVAAKALTSMWEVGRSESSGVIGSIAKKTALCEPLLVPHNGPSVGPCDDQDFPGTLFRDLGVAVLHSGRNNASS